MVTLIISIMYGQASASFRHGLSILKHSSYIVSLVLTTLLM